MAVNEKKVLQKVELPGTDILTFVGKFDSERKQDLTINNPTDATVAFKLKVTAPKLLRLHPGYGYVKPKEKLSIVVTAKAGGSKPLGRDRVVVLLAVAPDGRPENPVQFWRGADAPKDPRRQVFPLKFVEEVKGGAAAKGRKAAEKKEEKPKEKAAAKKEEKTEEESDEESGEESDADESEQ